MLHVVTWRWGNKYPAEYVAKLERGVARNLKEPHRFLLAEPEAEDRYLTEQKGCFCRLRTFDPAWQQAKGIAKGERIVSIDLDTVITGPLDALFDRPEVPFVIMQGGNASNPCPFNGALQMLRAGCYPEVWSDFSLEAASKIKFYEFPDDQGWLWHKRPYALGWKCGPETGVYVFRKPGWPGYKRKEDSSDDENLPAGARLVTFSGWRSPERFAHLKWVQAYWK